MARINMGKGMILDDGSDYTQPVEKQAAVDPLPSSPCYQDLERWIRDAAPLLEKAACIVIDESIERLDEIAGVRAVLEMCPIDFTDNASAQTPTPESE